MSPRDDDEEVDAMIEEIESYLEYAAQIGLLDD